MERKLASIQTIKSLEPIEGADKIERATILGWHLVVKKDEFKVGEKCVYMEVDSILPEKPEFEFLRPRGFRIKTIRLRKQVSQGIAFPLSILPPKIKHYDPIHGEGGSLPMIPDYDEVEYDEGEDVTEILEVKKYEPYIPAQLAGQIKGSFPGFLIKTDETRIQSVPDVLERHRHEQFQMTEKIDGSSMTVYLNKGEFGVCSRNLDIKEDENNSFWKIARKLFLEKQLKTLPYNAAFQGELLGPGVQKNKYGLEELDFYIFNIFNIDTNEYVNFASAHVLLDAMNLKTVPYINGIELNHSVDDLIELSEGSSLINPKIHREGLVFRPQIEARDKDLGRLSFKVINPKFLLKYDE